MPPNAPQSDQVNVVDDQGRTIPVNKAEVSQVLDENPGFHVETEPEAFNRAANERDTEPYQTWPGKIATGAYSALSGATLGLSDVAVRALGGQRFLQYSREANPGIDAGANIAGALLTGGFGAPEAVAGKVVGEGAGLGAKVLRSATEGAVYGAGSGVSDLAASSDPLTVEHIASALSSNMLYGGLIGGATGTIGGLAEKGLSRASDALEDLHANGGGAADVARVQEGADLVADLASFRQDLKENKKIFLATKGIKEPDLADFGPKPDGALKVQEIGKTALDADRSIDRMLRNPQYLAENPKPILGALQQQETALMKLQERESSLRQLFAKDTSGTRAASLDAVPDALEQNRALQQRVRQLIAPTPSKANIGAEMMGGAAFAGTLGVAHAIPVPGVHYLAYPIAAKVSKLAESLVNGKLADAVAEGAGRAAKVVDKFAKGVGTATKAAPAAATGILKAVRYAPEPPPVRGQKPAPEPTTLAGVFKKRTDEIKSQTMYDGMGNVVMRPEARAQVTQRLAPIATKSPVLADRLETVAARKIEFLSSMIPRAPDLPGITAKNWKPSDMQMRTWAVMANAVEHPDQVEERLASGKMTPEEALAYRSVYSERHAALSQGLIAAVAQAKKPPPYSKRLALAIFTGQAVDPSTDPRVIAGLQSHFANETGSLGGTSNPVPSPAFGSVKKSAPEPTPSEKRAQGG